MGIFDWLKKGAPMPKVTAFVESKPVLSKILGYAPKSPVEFAAAATGAGLISQLGVVGAAKVTAIGVKTAAPKVTKAIIPKTVKGKIIGVTAGILGVGILKKSPTAREAAVGAARGIQEKPAEIFKFGEKIGEFIEGKAEKPSVVEGLKKAGIVGGIAALAAGAIVVAPKAIEKIKEFKGIPSDKETPIGIEGETPILPETTAITTPKKRYKRRRATKAPSVRQSVRVNVINRSTSTGIRITNKRYLNEKLLA